MNELRESQVSVRQYIVHPWKSLHAFVATAELNFLNIDELTEVNRSSLLDPSRDVHLGNQ
jgi:hypothetical protein